jgi:hypothetical protein
VHYVLLAKTKRCHPLPSFAFFWNRFARLLGKTSERTSVPQFHFKSHNSSLSEQRDTCTPADKLVFTVLGAVAELERSLIVERV